MYISTVTLNREMLAAVSLLPNQVRPVARRAIAHALVVA
jgi:hypothetical protein